MLTHSEILYSHLVDGSIEPVYLWEKEADLGVPSVVIIHDLFEDIGFYSQDIAWWVDRKYRVFGFNIHYYGNKKTCGMRGVLRKSAITFCRS